MNDMNYTQTFSMQRILNQALNPILCKKILDQIKSPLMQQSFILTNDQSFNQQQSNIPKRPFIPQQYKQNKQLKRPIITHKSNYYNYPYDKSFDNNYISYSSNYSENIPEKQINIILSPLDPNITQQRKKQQQQNTFDLFKIITDNLCSTVTNIHQQIKQQIQIPQSKYHQRRKIFNLKINSQNQHKKTLSILLNIKQKRNSHIQIKYEKQPQKQLTIQQTISILQANQHKQIANFIQLCLHIMNQMNKATSQIQFCNRNLPIVFSSTTSSQDSLQGVTNIDQNTQKALNRMNLKSVSNLLQKFSTKSFMKSNNMNIKEYHCLKNKISQSIQQIISSLNKVQEKINLFVSNPNIKQDLQKVFNMLQQKFTQFSTKSLFEQIQNLFKDIGFYQYLKDIHNLQYIWSGFQSSIFKQEQFINGIMRNHAIYKKQSFLSKETNYFETQLFKMGYSKN